MLRYLEYFDLGPPLLAGRVDVCLEQGCSHLLVANQIARKLQRLGGGARQARAPFLLSDREDRAPGVGLPTSLIPLVSDVDGGRTSPVLASRHLHLLLRFLLQSRFRVHRLRRQKCPVELLQRWHLTFLKIGYNDKFPLSGYEMWER